MSHYNYKENKYKLIQTSRDAPRALYYLWIKLFAKSNNKNYNNNNNDNSTIITQIITNNNNNLKILAILIILVFSPEDLNYRVEE